MYRFSLYIFILAMLTSCSTDVKENEHPEVNWTKENSTNLSKNIAEQEEIDINLYLGMRKNWKMTKTGSGLRYYIYEHGEEADVQRQEAGTESDLVKPEPGDIVQIEYKISLLDGTECYKTEEDEYEELLVDKSNVETGIQEGIKKMKVGDKAKLIIPSHLGHGLLGDLNKIPPLNTLVIDVHLLGIK